MISHPHPEPTERLRARRFLDSEEAPADLAGVECTELGPHAPQIGPVADTDPLAGCVRSIGIEMLARGKTEATSKEIREMISLAERPSYTEHHIGTVMALMGSTSRRVWVNGARPRVYDLRGLSPYVVLTGRQEGDRTAPKLHLAGPETLGGQPDCRIDEDEDSQGEDRSGPTN